MIRFARISLVAAALSLPLAFASPANADNKPTKSLKKAKSGDCELARKRGKTCQITFGKGSDVTGEGVGQGSKGIVVAKPVQHTSLIKLRTSFRDAILKSAEDF